MIITVTPAPAIDWTIELDDFQLGEVNRGRSTLREASGKGINVAWALRNAGLDVAAVFPSGGSTGEFIIQSLRDSGVVVDPVVVDHEVRTNVTLSVAGVADTKVNTEPAPLSDDEVHRLIEVTQRHTQLGDVLVLSGSLPPNVSPHFYRDLIEAGRRTGAICVLDSSGDALSSGIAAGPDLIKPNREELEELSGVELRVMEDAVNAAKELVARGVGAVLASLGEFGALYVDQQTLLHGQVAGVAPKNTVGAGDALLAGFIAGCYTPGGTPEHGLRLGLIWSASSVESLSTLFAVDMRHANNTTVTAEVNVDAGLGVGVGSEA